MIDPCCRFSSMENRNRFDEIDREQLAAQLVAVLDAHFQRPTPEEKRHILQLADRQISGTYQVIQKVSNGLKAFSGTPRNHNVVVD
jgi:hypothetical protein